MYLLDQGTGPAVVLVPGLGCDHTMYRPQLEMLEGMRCLAVDLRGTGRSPGLQGVPEHDVLALQAADIAAALRERDVDSAHLVGISYGGAVVQQFLIRYPELARSAVICDSLCDTGARTLGERLQFWPARAQPAMLRAIPRRALARATRAAYPRWPEAGEAMAQVFLTAYLDDLVTQRRVVNRIHFEQKLHECETPTLCLAGDHSKLAKSMMVRTHDALAHSEFHLIPNSFDPSSLCNPAAFTAHLQRWVQAREAGLPLGQPLMA
ncbi:alpha/beta fold hydrolase [Brachybacterium sacelli]|uniref:Pimeloyl-ACP methyl ester carboxylesterase n=1 Tax=Brachybacterium sacelli TaxID=173364 RepID=A0ABS4WZC2_9MICO|nr:alpha/beta hydrolase [Brachybacterium sacelli]MBP2381562.1 pimeloyl-ACP methyl ester carboxylesterase [Brachybacterium sacelli]